MHVALNGWFWDQPYVGSGQYVRHLVTQLRKLEPALRLSLILPPHIAAPEAIPDGVEVIPTRGPGGNLGKVWFEQRTVPAAAGRLRADLVHVPYWGPPLGSPAKLVTSVLDVIPLALPVYAGGWQAKLYTSLVTAAARGSAHIITLSEAAREDIVRYIGLPAEMITPIHLGVEARFHPRMGAENDAAIRRKYNLPDDFVLYFGGFDRRKNVNELLLAYTYVAQGLGDRVPLVIAGKEPAWGSSPVFPDLRKYAHELELDDLVQWVGYIDEADKPALYRLAKVFVFPSTYEGFGLHVVEAMASGTPTIALDIPVMREIVGDGAFLVQDARKMAGAIIAVVEQEPLRNSLINQGLAQATRFQWRKTARETLNIYEKLRRS